MFKTKKKIERIKTNIRKTIDINLDLANKALDEANKFVESPDIYSRLMEDYRAYRQEIRTLYKVLDLIEEES